MPPIRLKDNHVRLIAHNFRLLDENGDGKLDRQQAALLFRALGQTLTNASIDKILDAYFKQKSIQESSTQTPTKASMRFPGTAPESHEKNIPEVLDLNEFIKLFETNYEEPLITETLTDAFSLFDKDKKGTLSLNEVKDILTSPDAEPLSNDDLESIMNLAKSCSITPEGDNIDYVTLAEALLGKSNIPSSLSGGSKTWTPSP